MSYEKVIFVCTGNTCRSPMAASILNSRRPKEGPGARLVVESRGLVVLFPEPYNPKMIRVLKDNGVEIQGSEARQLEESDFGETTLILTMTAQQKERLLKDFEKARNVYTVGEFVGEEEDIADPYGGGMDEYAQSFINVAYFVNRVGEILWNEEIEFIPVEEEARFLGGEE